MLIDIWLCQRCHRVFRDRRQPGKVTTCFCSPGLPVTLVKSYDDGVTDCGDYLLRVMPWTG